jgi:predicted enzyme related to lactoylglutathione lyase
MTTEPDVNGSPTPTDGPVDAPIGLGRIGQIALTVRDVERATAFYRDKLGVSYLFSAPPKMAFFDCGGVRLLLGAAESEDDPRRSSILYFRVNDIQAAREELGERGVEFEREPEMVHETEAYQLWLAFFHDGEGNTHALMSEVKG